MNEKHDKKIKEANENITMEDILKTIKQKNDNTNIQKELETHLRKITHLNEYELKVVTSEKYYLGLQLHNVDNPEVINKLDKFMKHKSRIEEHGDYLLIEYELD